jgi:hypothetical protein
LYLKKKRPIHFSSENSLAISHKNTHYLKNDDEKEKESRDYNNKEEEEE